MSGNLRSLLWDNWSLTSWLKVLTSMSSILLWLNTTIRNQIHLHSLNDHVISGITSFNITEITFKVKRSSNKFPQQFDFLLDTVINHEISHATSKISPAVLYEISHKVCFWEVEHEHEFIQPQQQQCRWLCAAQQLWLLNS